MIYAQRVRSPLKGGVDIELGEKTLLVGPNGAGKTAVLQALKLGTRGYVDDQEGKDNVSGTAAIARLFPRGSELRAEVDMSDGAAFSWSTKTRGTGYTKPKVKVPYKVYYPFQTLKTLLSGDDKKIRGWLEKRVGGGLTDEELINMVPPVQHEVAEEALTLFPGVRSPVDLSNSLKTRASSMRRKATAQEKTIDSLVEGVPLPLSEEDEVSFRERAVELWEMTQNDTGVVQAQHDKMRDTIHAMAAQLEATQAQIDSLPAVTQEQRDAANLVETAHRITKDHLQVFGDGFCQVCQRDGAKIEEESFGKWGVLMGQMQEGASRTRLQQQYDRGIQQVKGLIERFKGLEVVDHTALLEEHGALTERLGSHESSKASWGRAEALRKQVSSDRAQATAYASLGKTWLKEGELLLRQRKTRFEDKVSAWLEGDTFAVDLKAGRVGLIRGEEIHTGLSGGELSKVLLAILSAEEEERGSTPTILEPEDRGWDPDTLVGVMTALSDAPDQVILMSTVLPTRAPEGWTILEMGA